MNWDDCLFLFFGLKQTIAVLLLEGTEVHHLLPDLGIACFSDNAYI